METKQKRWVNIALIIIIFVGVTVFYMRNPADMIVVHVEEEILIIEGTEDVRYDVPIDSIQKIEYVENAVYAGKPQEKQKIICGQYINERWGEHSLCVYAEMPTCIVVYSQDGTYVFNYEGLEMTKELYDALLEL